MSNHDLKGNVRGGVGEPAIGGIGLKQIYRVHPKMARLWRHIKSQKTKPRVKKKDVLELE